MEIRYLSSEDDLLEISDIYEKSWKYAYKNIVPQDFLDSIPAGRWAERNCENCCMCIKSDSEPETVA